MNLKKEISKRLKDTQSQPFLFVGSGISKRYLGLESWDELLRKFSTEMQDDEFKYDYYRNLIKIENYYGQQAEIALQLEKDFAAEYLSSEKYLKNRIQNKDSIQKGISPLKIEIANHFKETQLVQNNDEELGLLKKIAFKNVAGVITTNYDLFLESIFGGFKTYIGQDELIFSKFLEVGEIYKIHGCCTKPESIIITQEDYKNFEEKSAYLISKLLTIFLEHPIIFIGYSISDRNILNILETISKCLPQEKLELLRDRFIFVERNISGNTISTHSANFSNGRKIEMTKVSTDNFSLIYEAILENNSKYNPKILRKLKEDIYDLVLTNEPKGAVASIDIEKLEDYRDLEIIVGVGLTKSMGKKGYISLKATDIYLDIINDRENYLPEHMIEGPLRENLKQNSGGLPFYKYLSKTDTAVPKFLENHLKNDLNEFLNTTEKNKKELKRKNLKEKSIKLIYEKYDFKDALDLILYLNEDEINIEELLQFLKNYLTLNDDFEKLPQKSNFKKLIRIYDYLKYKK